VARKQFDYDWTKIPEVQMYGYTKEEEDFWPFQNLHPKWNIPEKIAIQCAISGGGARITPKQNPYHPGTDLDTIMESAAEVLELETGPSCIHFDHPPDQLQNRKGEKFDFGDSYAYVVEPLIRKYGYEKLCCHINTLRGTTEQQMLPVVTGLAELTYLQPRASTNWLKTILPVMEENGLAFEIAVHVNSELDLARRILLEPGLIKKPAMWCVLYGLPMKGPRWHFEFIPNEMAMAQHLVLTVERIREMDPDAKIQVMQGARPSRYMVVLAMLLGLNIRVGHEDSVFKYPHKDEPLVSNAEEVKWAIETARLLGREVMTPAEYREYIGVEPRTGNDPYAYMGIPA
jgi:3-keto-5-aminohexanoate cleavage enzyme